MQHTGPPFVSVFIGIWNRLLLFYWWGINTLISRESWIWRSGLKWSETKRNETSLDGQHIKVQQPPSRDEMGDKSKFTASYLPLQSPHPVCFLLQILSQLTPAKRMRLDYRSQSWHPSSMPMCLFLLFFFFFSSSFGFKIMLLLILPHG